MKYECNHCGNSFEEEEIDKEDCPICHLPTYITKKGD
jgi:rubrerythrin